MNKFSRAAWHRGACSVAGILALGLTLAVAPAAAQTACTGDCNDDGQVSVDELVTMVNIALGAAPVDDCMAGDANGDGTITVDEIVTAVNNALNGCGGTAACGNGTTDSGEECDDGGICIGGTNAGTACTAEDDCQGDGVCVGGSKADSVCSSTPDCPGGACMHCVPFGGDGCAANCTMESEVTVNLIPGEVVNDVDIKEGTSGILAHADILTVPLPWTGSVTLRIGKELNDSIPVAVRTSDLNYPAIDVLSGTACACVRGLAFRTCGGTVFEADGTTPTTDCTTAGDAACAGGKPCTAIFGEGNAASGVVGCTGLSGVDVTVTQDHLNEPPPPPMIVRSGSGGPGSVVLGTASSFGFVLGPCTGTTEEYGPDGTFCTADDPPSSSSNAVVSTLTTGTATETIVNANKTQDLNIGPFSATGTPADCLALAGGSASGAALASVFPVFNQDPIGDLVVTTLQIGQ